MTTKTTILVKIIKDVMDLMTVVLAEVDLSIKMIKDMITEEGPLLNNNREETITIGPMMITIDLPAIIDQGLVLDKAVLPDIITTIM